MAEYYTLFDYPNNMHTGNLQSTLAKLVQEEAKDLWQLRNLFERAGGKALVLKGKHLFGDEKTEYIIGRLGNPPPQKDGQINLGETFVCDYDVLTESYSKIKPKDIRLFSTESTPIANISIFNLIYPRELSLVGNCSSYLIEEAHIFGPEIIDNLNIIHPKN